jgi:uncharacterized protein (TIGR03083 family)
MLDDGRMLDVLEADVRRLDAVDVDRLDRPVPACAGWTALDVLAHLGVIHRRLARMLVDGEAYRPLREQPPPPPADEVVAWQRQMSHAMVDALRTVDLDAPTTAWFAPAVGRDWLRRMMHEAAVHRWDVESAVAAAAPTPLDPDVAVDGVDELFEVFAPMLDAATWTDALPAGASVHLHATDAPGEWYVVAGAEGLGVTHEHAKGDVAVRGPASDLLLLLWGRRSPADVEVFGDRDLLDGVLATASF